MKKITMLTLMLFSAYVFAQSEANYDISITTIWNATEHTSVPGNAHWSPLAGATHKNPNDILEFGVTAPLTNGIKNIAETGNTTNFMSEVNTMITSGNADQYLQQSFSPFAGNNSSATISGVSVNEDFPLITLVSMVAPSPDWFIAVNGENLRSGNPAVNNGWRDTFTMDVFVYDAGTDSGADYTSGNLITNPRTPITMVTGSPINGNRMATVTFTYNSSTLSNDVRNVFENIEVFPNPTTDKFTISNIRNTNLKRIEIYSLLGKLSKTIIVNNTTNNLEVDVSNLTSGIYLLKLKNEEDSSKTQKLIVR
ncbi:T9SS type A sorting domain-containing protein [Jejuia pallidilutea]|uniref:F-spondin n=1 Tax=Jejuia pallidilutea TaxID=504487 RepID=A0A090VPN2_9FLAO|nr:spondin domain-containing protein [Jejuia pallidilutea]GAL66671.1 F-spondin precursor [Jejuia pallidilutea]GAL69932.1 F-spondin precursor [Jejuia pallidilutea]GAL90944.1 F-spondin precursor [Jejuia pallidilutea]